MVISGHTVVTVSGGGNPGVVVFLGGNFEWYIFGQSLEVIPDLLRYIYVSCAQC